MKTKFFLLMIALLICAVPMFAQGGGAAGGGGGNIWVPVTAGFAMAIASGLCALGQGKAVAGACRRHRAQPLRIPGNPFRADFRSCADRISRVICAGYYLCQSSVVLDPPR